MNTDQTPESSPEESSPPLWAEGLSDRQRRFVEEYCIDSNATQAAIRAGYSEHTAKHQASRMRTHVDIARAIQARFTELSMSAEEAAKHLSDIAATRLNDYMTVKPVYRPTRVKKGLAELIQELEDEIAFEDEFAQEADYDKTEQKVHEKEQKKRRRKVLRYQIELAKNPGAFREVAGEPELVEEASLDLVALAKAKDKGRIKSISFTEQGPKVELYSDHGALTKLLEYHGKMIKKHEHSGPGGSPIQVEDLSQLSTEELQKLLVELQTKNSHANPDA